jgi:hypothetical protein
VATRKTRLAHVGDFEDTGMHKRGTGHYLDFKPPPTRRSLAPTLSEIYQRLFIFLNDDLENGMEVVYHPLPGMPWGT